MSEGQPSATSSSKSSPSASDPLDTVQALENIQNLLDKNKQLLKKAHRYDTAGEVEKNEVLLQELHRNIQQVCSKVRTLADTETQGGGSSLEHYVPALIELGTLESRQRDFPAAVKHLSAGVKLEITPQALNNLAIAYQELGEHLSAVSVYQRALKLDEDDASAHYNLGTALEKAGEYKAAVKAYREAIELEPEEAKYYNNMGGSLAAYNRTETAERSYKCCVLRAQYAMSGSDIGYAATRAIKLKPKYWRFVRACALSTDSVCGTKRKFTDAYFNLGNLLLATGNIEGAIERLEQALKIEPAHAKAKAKLKDARRQLEEKVEAFKGQVDDAIEKAHKMMRRGELR